MMEEQKRFVLIANPKYDWENAPLTQKEAAEEIFKISERAQKVGEHGRIN